MTPQETKKEIMKEFEQFWLTNEDLRFVLSKMSAKLGDVAVEHCKESIELFLSTALDRMMEVTKKSILQIVNTLLSYG